MKQDDNATGPRADQLREHVLAAKARYELAHRAWQELQELAHRLGPGALYHPHALNRAAASLESAVADYQHAVEHLSDFVNQPGPERMAAANRSDS